MYTNKSTPKCLSLVFGLGLGVKEVKEMDMPTGEGGGQIAPWPEALVRVAFFQGTFAFSLLVGNM